MSKKAASGSSSTSRDYVSRNRRGHAAGREPPRKKLKGNPNRSRNANVRRQRKSNSKSKTESSSTSEDDSSDDPRPECLPEEAPVPKEADNQRENESPKVMPVPVNFCPPEDLQDDQLDIRWLETILGYVYANKSTEFPNRQSALRPTR